MVGILLAIWKKNFGERIHPAGSILRRPYWSPVMPVMLWKRKLWSKLTSNRRQINYRKLARIDCPTGYTIFRRNGVSRAKSDHTAWKRARWTPQTWPRSWWNSFFLHFLTSSSGTVKFQKQATGYTWALSDPKSVMKKTSRKKAPYRILGRNIHTLSPIWRPHCENENFRNITNRLSVACRAKIRRNPL